MGCAMKIIIETDKVDEFSDSLHPLLRDIRKQKGCLDYRMYRDPENESSFCILGEWNSNRDMEDHFRTHNFEVLLGATKVLGLSFNLIITEVLETGGYDLAESKSRS